MNEVNYSYELCEGYMNEVNYSYELCEVIMRKVLNPLTKKWEFETSQGYLADAFLQVLEIFHLDPEDVYIPSFVFI